MSREPTPFDLWWDANMQQIALGPDVREVVARAFAGGLGYGSALLACRIAHPGYPPGEARYFSIHEYEKATGRVFANQVVVES